MISSVYILGLGALGSIYAEKLSDLSPDLVRIIAGSGRISTFRQNGVTINGKPYSFNYVSPDDPASVPADLILVAVKSTQLEAGIRDILPFVGPDTIVLSLLNGISSEEIIGRVIGDQHLLYSYALGMDSVRQGNAITYANAGRIVFGEKHNESISERVRSVKELFDKAKIDCRVPVNMEKAMWMKFMMNTGINQASAVLKAPYGVFQQKGEARKLMLAASLEVVELSLQAGVGLGEPEITEYLRTLDSLHPEGKTSMLQDIEAGRLSEVDLFAGTVIRLGKKYNMATPVNDVLYKIIISMEEMSGARSI